MFLLSVCLSSLTGDEKCSAAVELDFCTVMPLKLWEALYLFCVCAAVAASLAAHKSMIAKRNNFDRALEYRKNQFMGCEAFKWPF